LQRHLKYNQLSTKTRATQMSSTSSSKESRLDLSDYFKECVVTQMSIIERPRNDYQVYKAKHLSKCFHFSCPTGAIPSLFVAIRDYNNKKVKIMFIPRSCKFFTSDQLCVSNKNIDNASILSKESQFNNMSLIINENGIVAGSSSKNKSKFKRTKKSISIGLQTMYSHQQHKSRYCMLPHSTPFVPTVKKYDINLLLSITDAYIYSSQVVYNVNKNMGQSRTPSSMKGRRDICGRFCTQEGIHINIFARKSKEL
jgi:hypothetical protein